MPQNDNEPLIDIWLASINIDNRDNDHDNWFIRHFRASCGSVNVVTKLTL
jgi:hypothetical protein